jgi:hypothetical protein
LWSLNAWLLEACEKPILAMFEQMCHQMMQWFHKRCHINIETEGLLVSTTAKAIQTSLTMYAWHYRIILADDNIYEVFSIETSKNYIIKVFERICSCWAWQSSRLLCAHAIVICLNRKDNPQLFVVLFYSLMAYRETYTNPIFPPNLDAVDT